MLGVRKPLVCRKRGTFGPTVLGDYAARNRARDRLASAVCSVRVLSKVEYPGSWITWVFRYLEDWQSTLPHVICPLAYFGCCTMTRRTRTYPGGDLYSGRSVGLTRLAAPFRAVGSRLTPGTVTVSLLFGSSPNTDESLGRGCLQPMFMSTKRSIQ